MYSSTDYVAFIPAEEYLREFRDAEKFINFCRRCNRYGTCWACPPFGFDTDQYLSGCHSAVIIGTKIVPDKSLSKETDPGLNRSTGEEIIRREREKLDPLLLELEALYPGSRAFYAGTCHLCPDGKCTRPTGETCRYPDLIRPSLESCGFDIGRTASELLHTELKWSEGGRLPEYFTLVSGFFTNHKPEEIAWKR